MVCTAGSNGFLLMQHGIISSKQTCAQPCRRSTGGNIDHKVQGVLLFVVPEHVRPDNAFQFRIKMRKEV